jgi:hypothetical protein
MEIGGVPGSKSMRNLMSRSSGLPHKSSGNTSRYPRTTQISYKEFPCAWLSILVWLVVTIVENSTSSFTDIL